jgi:ribosome-binding factor A
MDRKGAQLCAQVRRALEYIVPDALADTQFDAIVLEVRPAPNPSNLVVIVQSTVVLNEDEQRSLQEVLSNRIGRIRTAIAESIHRRKAPTISIYLIQT